MTNCTGLRRKTAVFLLAAVLSFPWAASATPRLGSARGVAPSASTFLEDLLDHAWSFLAGGVRNKEGCHLDPDGRFTPGAIRTDEGCHIDPSGGCSPRPATRMDSGCHLDPNGGCRS
jgi:hypothetical protein